MLSPCHILFSPPKPLAHKHLSPGALVAWEWRAVHAWGNWGCIQKRGLIQNDKSTSVFFFSLLPSVLLPFFYLSNPHHKNPMKRSWNANIKNMLANYFFLCFVYLIVCKEALTLSTRRVLTFPTCWEIMTCLFLKFKPVNLSQIS